MKCQTIRSRKRRVCAGDLDTQIEIFDRNIRAPDSFSGWQHNQDYTPKATPWALVKSLNGIATFDGINLSGVQSLEIFIRYRDDVTAEDFVRIDGQNIEITSVEDLDRRKEFLRLVCLDRGAVEKEASL